MKTQLENIASIQSGIYVIPDSYGEIVCLQGKDFDEEGKMKTNLKAEIQLNKQTQKHILKYGDILFAAKGTRNYAAVHQEKEGLYVASSTFMIIRINENSKNIISPDYLAWYINNPTTQTWLKGKSWGSGLPSISKGSLVEMIVTIPSIEKQSAILKINSFRKLEKSIQKQLSDLKEQYIQQLLQNTLK